LADLQQQFLHLLLDEGPVLPEQLDLIIEFGKLIQNFVFVFLVDLAEVDNFVRSVLNRMGVTRPNIPQSEQMASLQSSQ
jgi:hypothetical protein